MRAMQPLKFLAEVGDTGESRFLAMCALIAFFAGGVKTAMGKNPTPSSKDIAVGACASALSGTLVAMTCLYLWGAERQMLIGAISGLAGWIGPVLLDWAGSVALTVIKERWGNDRGGQGKE
jgi:hypothetical protein